jgi:hypothetical protein
MHDFHVTYRITRVTRKMMPRNFYDRCHKYFFLERGGEQDRSHPVVDGLTGRWVSVRVGQLCRRRLSMVCDMPDGLASTTCFALQNLPRG